MEVVKRLNPSGNVNIEVKIIEGRDFVNSHSLITKPSFLVVMQVGETRGQSIDAKRNADKTVKWDTNFVFAANLTNSNLAIQVYCYHQSGQRGSTHVIGEASLDLLKTPRNEDIDIQVYDPNKSPAKVLSGHLTIHLKVSMNFSFSGVEFSNVVQPQSTHFDIFDSLTSEQIQMLSPKWQGFLSAFSGVISQAQQIANLDSRAKLAVQAISFAVQAVLDQVARDEKIEKLIQIIGDLYTYYLDTDPMAKILTYKKTLERLLNQTSECAHFIGEYQKIKSFTQRAVVNLVSDADNMITQFENSFGELKVELIMGSSLQTAVVSFRILNKVENIESLLYIERLPYLKRVSWSSDRTCLRGTREDIITDIVHWATHIGEKQQSRIYLLSGPQGCGKSAIAHTIAGIFDEAGRLGAALFTHNYTDQQSDVQTLSSTIAYQLASYDSTMQRKMADIIKAQPHLASAEINRQFPDLIVAAAKDLTVVGPVIIVVDALSNSPEQTKLIKAIIKYSPQLPPNFRILLTSAPERINTLADSPHHHVHKIVFDDGEGGNRDIQNHISIYVDRLFEAKPILRERYDNAELQSQIAKRAIGMHFWVTTAYRALSSTSHEVEHSILERILSNPLPQSKEEAIDHLYHAVIDILQIIPDSDEVFVHVLLHFLLKSGTPPVHHGIQTLRDMGLVIDKSHNKEGTPQLHLHPSFKDFLTNPHPENNPYDVDMNLPSQDLLWELCINKMNNILKHNLCEVGDIMALNDEILNKEDLIHQFIPPTLQYTCRNWVSRLQDASPNASVESALPNLHEFLFKHLLHWIEVMSILGHFDEVLPCLEQLAAWLKNHVKDSQEHAITNDAIRFIRNFAPIISKAAMQTYISALLLMPSDTLLFQVYHEEAVAGRSNLKSDLSSGWSPTYLVKQDHFRDNLSTPTKFATSANLIARQINLDHPDNGNICFYDSRTGQEVNNVRLVAINEYIISMAFSPDCQHIAIGHESTFGIWDVKTGNRVHPERNLGLLFRGQIAYSRDGTRIVLVQSNTNYLGSLVAGQVIILNADTLENIYTLSLDYPKPLRIDLSPDGRILAVHELSSDMGTLLFDVDSGGVVGEPIVTDDISFRRSGGEVIRRSEHQSIAWSPDGRSLAIVTQDQSPIIHLRSINGGTRQRLRLHGHLIVPTCPVFSPDGTYIAILSNYRQTAEIWETDTGKLISSQELKSKVHLSEGTSGAILFHPNGREVLFTVGLYHFWVHLSRLPVHNINYSSNVFASQPFTIQYTQLTTTTNIKYSSQVDHDGWILNTDGEQQMWVPYPNFDISSKDQIELEGHKGLSSKLKTLDVKDPKTGGVVLTIKIDFQLKDE